MKKKSIALLMACVMVFGAAVGGTMAWLTATDNPVVNTFTVGDINIELTETGTETKDDVEAKEYSFVPGSKLAKDPKVTIIGSDNDPSEASYLFVKVQENNNILDNNSKPIKRIIEWNVDIREVKVTQKDVEWKKYGNDIVDSTTGNIIQYWYCEAPKTSTNMSWYILSGNNTEVDGDTPYLNGYVVVNTEVKKDDVETINDSKPTLTFWAAAVQRDNLTLEQAVDELPDGFMIQSSGN